MAKAEESDCDKTYYDDITLESLGAHLFFGDVNETTAQAAAEFVLKSNLFNQNSAALTIFFNTSGGESADGFALIDMMETSRLPVATVGIGQIASMGMLMISAGSPGLRSITRNSEVMAHQFSGYFSGKQHELIATQQAHNMTEKRFIRHFLRHSAMSEKQVRDILFSPTDRYLTPQECKKFGLVDNVVEFAQLPKLKPTTLKKTRR